MNSIQQFMYAPGRGHRKANIFTLNAFVMSLCVAKHTEYWFEAEGGRSVVLFDTRFIQGHCFKTAAHRNKK
jgi:hypothetical protein